MRSTRSPRLVTKSVRLSQEESEILAAVSEREHFAEGSLLRKLVLDGLARYRLEGAVAEYVDGEVNLGEAAQRAGVSVARLLSELDRRGIDTIGPRHYQSSLENLADAFGASPALRDLIASRHVAEGESDVSKEGEAEDI